MSGDVLFLFVIAFVLLTVNFYSLYATQSQVRQHKEELNRLADELLAVKSRLTKLEDK